MTSVRRTAFVAVLGLVALLLPLTQLASANHGSRTLDANPETQSHEINTDAEIIATVSSAATFDSGPINIDFENESGENDSDGTSLGTPDEQCTIPAGQTSCSITYQGTVAGTDTWRVWIDHDGLNGSQGGQTEADDTEAREESVQEGGFPGEGGTNCSGAVVGPAEPDCTDVVEVTWTNTSAPPVPTTLDCDDSTGPDRERETNPAGSGPASSETYTCVVKDQYGNPARDNDPNTDGNQQITVRGENETGINDPDVADDSSYGTPDYSCNLPTTATGNGTCTITVTQAENEVGTANICFWVGNDNNAAATECAGEATGPVGEDSGDDLQDRVELTWAAREASGLDLENEKETHVVGETRVVTARVYDQFGDPFQGNTTVNFEFFENSPTDRTQENGDGNTPDSVDATCTTNNDSSCAFEYQNQAGGRDLICGWVGTSPTMSGTSRNASGTCGGEGRNDADDAADEEDAADPAGDRIDLVETTWTNDPPATVVDCKPEVSASLVETSRKVTCTASTSEPNSKVANTEIDIEITGANDPDNGNSRGTPDMVCTTNDDGVCSVTHGPGNATKDAGKTNYTAWIDPDYEDESTEADPDEGRPEAKTPGANAEPDNTDVVTHRWRSGDRTVSLTVSDHSVKKGTRVQFTGKIEGEAPACERNQTATLQQRPANGSSKFTARRTRVSDAKGNIDFGGFKVWKDLDFRIIVNAAGPCIRAVSPTQTVDTR